MCASCDLAVCEVMPGRTANQTALSGRLETIFGRLSFSETRAWPTMAQGPTSPLLFCKLSDWNAATGLR